MYAPTGGPNVKWGGGHNWPPMATALVLGVLNSPVATPAHGLLGLRPSLRLQFISENASVLALYVCSTTHGPTSLSC